MSRVARFHGWLMRVLLPKRIHERHGAEQAHAFQDLLAEARERGAAAVVILLLRESRGALEVRWQEGRAAPRRHPASSEYWRGCVQDIRYAGRLLRRFPQFTLVVVLTLAVGIGGNASVFTVVNGAFFRPLPYARSEELVQIWSLHQQPYHERMTVAPADFTDYLRQSRSFTDIGAHNLWYPAMSTSEGADRVLAEYVTPNLLPLLGVQPILGRQFTEDEGREDTRHVTLLSWGAWQRRFGGARDVLGQTVRLNGELYQVIGVLPKSYRHPDPHRPLEEPELVTPIRFDLDLRRNSQFLRVIGRLAPGVRVEAARTELAGIARQLAQDYPETNRDRAVNLVPLRDNFFGSLARPFAAALIAAGLLLLIACANIANLVLARSQGRRREFAVRSAIGASRGRLARQLIIESVLLSLMGGSIGLLLVAAGSGSLRALQGRFVPAIADIRIDANVVAYTMGICLLTALLFGLAPLLELRRGHLREILTEETAGSGGARRTQRIRAGLVVAEVALSVALVIATGVLARSFFAVRQVDLGFDAEHALVLEVVVPRARYPEEPQTHAFLAELTRRLQALPGVDTVGLVSDFPLKDGNTSVNVRPDAADFGAALRLTEFVAVTPGYLEAMRVPLLGGRGLRSEDAGTSELRPVVVSASLARTFWPGQSALGRRIFERDGESADYTVIGVVGDVLDDAVTGAPDPTLYFLTAHQFQRRLNAVVRTAGDPRALIASVRRTVRDLDTEVPVVNIMPLAEIVSRRMEPQRFAASFATVFTALALLLASLGIYGVVAYAVASRTREIGIRSVLGADAATVRRSVLAAAVKLVVPGVALGILLGLAQARLIGSFLFDVPAIDPLSFLVATLILPLIALVAGWLPARRAARIQPIDALRSQ